MHFCVHGRNLMNIVYSVENSFACISLHQKHWKTYVNTIFIKLYDNHQTTWCYIPEDGTIKVLFHKYSYCNHFKKVTLDTDNISHI
jgi:hypothetical protein